MYRPFRYQRQKAGKKKVIGGCNHTFAAAESRNSSTLSKDRKVVKLLGATACENGVVLAAMPMFQSENHMMHTILHWQQLAAHFTVNAHVVDYACQYRGQVRRFLDWLEPRVHVALGHPALVPTSPDDSTTLELPAFFKEHFTGLGFKDDRALGACPYGFTSVQRARQSVALLCLNPEVFTAHGTIAEVVFNIASCQDKIPGGWIDPQLVYQTLCKEYGAEFNGGKDTFHYDSASPDWFGKKVGNYYLIRILPCANKQTRCAKHN